MKLLIKNISILAGIDESGRERIVGAEMGRLRTIENAWLTAEDGKITGYGPMSELPQWFTDQERLSAMPPEQSSHKLSCGLPPEHAAQMREAEASKSAPQSTTHTCFAENGTATIAANSHKPSVRAEDVARNNPAQKLYPTFEVLDAAGGVVLPAFCDSHTHIVYAGSREGEFVDKLNGLSYEEIARRGGGILNSADRLHEASEDELFEQAMPRLREMLSSGTGSVEIKSGYGLSTEDELKMLRVIRRLRESSPMTVRSTFLGAHAVSRAYRGRQAEYVDLICREMIPAVAAEGLADFIDVFCDKGFFTPEETSRMLECGARYGMRPKIHANELAASGGIQVGVEHDALSVDHLEFTGPEEIAVLKTSRTMPTLLPGAAFFLEMDYPPARLMIDSGLGVALATDYNPGSSPSGNMKLVLSIACVKMKMNPREAINAATLNGAYAMGLHATHGSITIGKRADLFISKPVPSLDFLPYAYGSNLTAAMVLDGKVVEI